MKIEGKLYIEVHKLCDFHGTIQMECFEVIKWINGKKESIGLISQPEDLREYSN